MCDRPADDPANVLLSAARRTIPTWLERRLFEQVAGSADGDVDEATAARVAAVAASTAADMLVALAALLNAELDDQATSPLAVIRAGVGPANALLSDLGATPPTLDEFERRNFPDDRYRLGPKSWSDIDPSLHEPGLTWGAWKAFTLMRRRATGD